MLQFVFFCSGVPICDSKTLQSSGYVHVISHLSTPKLSYSQTSLDQSICSVADCGWYTGMDRLQANANLNQTVECGNDRLSAFCIILLTLRHFTGMKWNPFCEIVLMYILCLVSFPLLLSLFRVNRFENMWHVNVRGDMIWLGKVPWGHTNLPFIISLVCTISQVIPAFQADHIAGVALQQPRHWLHSWASDCYFIWCG